VCVCMCVDRSRAAFSTRGRHACGCLSFGVRVLVGGLREACRVLIPFRLLRRWKYERVGSFFWLVAEDGG